MTICRDPRDCCLRKRERFHAEGECTALSAAYPDYKCPFAKKTIDDKPYAMKKEEET